MDLLDDYKKAWKNQPEGNQKISAVEIYKMAQAKSTSIVKWIFIIGLLEFAFMICSTFIFDTRKQEEIMTEMGVNQIVKISNYLTLPVFLYFLFLFYKNFKSISITDSTKKLMTKIRKTRRTVRNYVIFNLTYILFVSTIMTFGMVFGSQDSFQNTPGWLIILLMALATLIILLLFWGFYQLLYGILLKKLNKNYTELAKLHHEA
jgi:hypothetical protein